MKGILIFFTALPLFAFSQVEWINVDSNYQPLPNGVHVYKTTSLLDGKPNIAYYVEADLDSKDLDFTADTSYQRRLTPSRFYEKNDSALVVVNTSFFSFSTNQNLNIVMRDREILAYNVHSVPGRGKDTLTYRHPFGSAIGIKKGEADVAWIYTDTVKRIPYAVQEPIEAHRDSVSRLTYAKAVYLAMKKKKKTLEPWKMETAVGGGPVLIQEGKIRITNQEELKFTGKAINDKHPRTAMGYTKDDKLIIMVVQGRFPGEAEGASLTQLADLLLNIGCYEALNLDGGGSSCMLVNGKETIRVSDKGGQRPVPGVFLILEKD